VFTASSSAKTKLSTVSDVYYSMNTQTLNQTDSIDETRIAEAIVSVLPDGVARELSGERRTIRFAVRAAGLKLRTIVLSRASLRKLIDDPARDVKIEYLQRDLAASAARRCEYRYPRVTRMPSFQASARPFAFAG
jgi:hypothetical protein